MTRRGLIVIVAISLLVGLLASVGVSWWIALPGPPPTGPGWTSPGPFMPIHQWPTARLPHGLGHWRFYEKGGRGWRSFVSKDYTAGFLGDAREAPSWTVAGSEDASIDGKEYLDIGFGWPRLALAYRTEPASDLPVMVSGADTRDASSGIVLGWLEGRPNVLPLRPILAGLLVNTGAFGAPVAAMLLLVVGARHLAVIRRRVRRGECRGCGYDLSGSPAGPCPECGREGA